MPPEMRFSSTARPRRASSCESARRNWWPPPDGGGASSWKSARSARPERAARRSRSVPTRAPTRVSAVRACTSAARGFVRSAHDRRTVDVQSTAVSSAASTRAARGEQALRVALDASRSPRPTRAPRARCSRRAPRRPARCRTAPASASASPGGTSRTFSRSVQPVRVPEAARPREDDGPRAGRRLQRHALPGGLRHVLHGHDDDGRRPERLPYVGVAEDAACASRPAPSGRSPGARPGCGWRVRIRTSASIAGAARTSVSQSR